MRTGIVIGIVICMAFLAGCGDTSEKVDDAYAIGRIPNIDVYIVSERTWDDLPTIEPGDTYMSSAMSIYRCQEQANQLYDELVYKGQWNTETVEGIICRPTDDGFNGCECTVKFCKDGTR